MVSHSLGTFNKMLAGFLASLKSTCSSFCKQISPDNYTVLNLGCLPIFASSRGCYNRDNWNLFAYLPLQERVCLEECRIRGVYGTVIAIRGSLVRYSDRKMGKGWCTKTTFLGAIIISKWAKKCNDAGTFMSRI